jgi:molecular chaperone GrpE
MPFRGRRGEMQERPMKKKDENDGGSEESGAERIVVIDRRPAYGSGEPEGAAERRYPSFVEELKARAERAEQQARDISAAYRRIDEERDALRERLSRDVERRVDIARGDLMRRMLTVADDLDRAIAAARGMGESSPLLPGVVLIREHLMQALAAEGVKAYTTVGEAFDPNLAEAVAVEPTEDAAADNRVIEELQPGYTLNGTLLRPARVRVARLQASPGTSRDAPAPEPPEPPTHAP